MRTARSRSSGEYLLGRGIGAILSHNGLSDEPGTVQLNSILLGDMVVDKVVKGRTIGRISGLPVNGRPVLRPSHYPTATLRRDLSRTTEAGYRG